MKTRMFSFSSAIPVPRRGPWKHRPWRAFRASDYIGAGSSADERRRLATTLMGYARTHPDRIRGKLMPVIVYDPVAGRQAFGAGIRKIREYESV